MTKLLTELGVSGGIGAVVGLLFATVVAPTTAEGVALLVFVGVVITVASARMIAFLRRRRKLYDKPKGDPAEHHQDPLRDGDEDEAEDVAPSATTEDARKSARRAELDAMDER